MSAQLMSQHDMWGDARALQLFAANELGVFRDICRWAEFCSATISDQRTHAALEKQGYTKYFDDLFKTCPSTPTVPLRIQKPQQQSEGSSFATALPGPGIVTLETDQTVPMIPIDDDTVSDNVDTTVCVKRKADRHRKGYNAVYKKCRRLMKAVNNLSQDAAQQLVTQYPKWSERLEAAKLVVVQPPVLTHT